MKPRLYYIAGDFNNYKKVIKILEQHGGDNKFLIKGDDDNCIYYIDLDGIIREAYCIDDIVRYITTFGEELFLEDYVEDFVSTYDDIKNPVGKNISVTFSDEYQQLAVIAASKIAQIRLQGKSFYGDLPKVAPTLDTIYYISRSLDNLEINKTECWKSGGGLLRFKTEQTAQLFMENNKELVKQYLEIF